MERRNFIRLSLTASAGALLTNPLGALSLKRLTTCDFEDRVLVLVQLNGGNDGINTIIPIDQYGIYANLRPDIKIPDSGINKFINLDNTLSIADQVGLHPKMTDFKSMYDDGLMNIIQGVSYNSMNKSHFRSTDIWMSGIDGDPSSIETGWLGRYFEDAYQTTLDYPLGIQVGNKKNARIYKGEHNHDSLNLTGQDPSGFYSIVSSLGGDYLANIPSSDYGDKIKYIQDVDQFSNTYGNTISNAFNISSNAISYPNHDLADQLKTVARLINGGLKTKVYLVTLNGFDTHNSQAEATDSTIGGHATLLTELSESVKAFYDDLKAMGHDERVLTSTFSEFGRKVKQNGNLGTDHGGIAPMFLFGPSVTPGITGTNVNLSEANSSNNWQLESYQHDYRQVFATILQDWFGTKDDIVDKSIMPQAGGDSFTTKKINFINSDKRVDPTCYHGLLVDSFVNENSPLKTYPNPINEFMNVEFDVLTRGNLQIIDLTGKIVYQQQINRPTKSLMINLSHIPPGGYTLNIISESHHLSKNILKN